MKWLSERISFDEDKQKVFAEYCGYIFIKPSVLKLEKMLILYGTGANGKSVFFGTNKLIVGSGLANGMGFDTSGQSSSLLYLGYGIDAWQALNTGAILF